jgi:hypothetical protein
VAKKLPKWQYTGDVNMLDYGGKFYRCVHGLRYQFVQFTNMNEACGRDNEGHDKYVVELSEIDLDDLSSQQIRSAMDCVGLNAELLKRIRDSDGIPAVLQAQAEACHYYGAKCPCGSWEGNNARKLLRDAYREADLLARDKDALYCALEKPVNKLGSTAREYARGDMESALARSVAVGDPSALLMRKIEQACALSCCGAVNRLGGAEHKPGCPVVANV